MFEPPQMAAVPTTGEPPMPTLPAATPPTPYLVPYTTSAFDFTQIRRARRRWLPARNVYSRTRRRTVLPASLIR